MRTVVLHLEQERRDLIQPQASSRFAKRPAKLYPWLQVASDKSVELKRGPKRWTRLLADTA